MIVNSDEAYLIMSIFDRALIDYIEFAQKCNPTNISKITSLRKHSPACILAEVDWWHPLDVRGAEDFFKSKLFNYYADILNIDSDYLLNKIKKTIKETLGGFYSPVSSFQFNLEGVGMSDVQLMHRRTLELVSKMIRDSEMVWKRSNVSYNEVIANLKESMSEKDFEDINFWSLGNLNHIETLCGKTVDQDTTMYLGCFAKSVTKANEETQKGPLSYKKYLLLIIGKNNNVYEVRNAGKIAKTIYTLYFNEEQEQQRDHHSRIIKFLEEMNAEIAKKDNMETSSDAM